MERGTDLNIKKSKGTRKAETAVKVDLQVTKMVEAIDRTNARQSKRAAFKTQRKGKLS